MGFIAACGQIGFNTQMDMKSCMFTQRHNPGWHLKDIIPDSWTWESTDIVELSDHLHIDINVKAILNESVGGAQCNAWFFADNRQEGVAFDKQDFYLGYYDESQDMIHIYRGHHLYAPR